jgi:YVTN family beta-propeller protein
VSGHRWAVLLVPLYVLAVGAPLDVLGTPPRDDATFRAPPAYSPVEMTGAVREIGMQQGPAPEAPRPGRAYVVNGLSANVMVIDTTTNTVLTTVPVGALPNAVAIGP